MIYWGENVKKIIICWCIIISLILSGCNSSSTQLTGTWSNGTDEMRFLEDGKLYYENVLMEYKIMDNKEIMYTTPTGETFIFQFEIKDDVLSLTYQGETMTFNRIAKD